MQKRALCAVLCLCLMFGISGYAAAAESDVKLVVNDVALDAEVAEWSKAHDWKSCVPLKGTKGSNPFLSAILIKKTLVCSVFFRIRRKHGLCGQLTSPK